MKVNGEGWDLTFENGTKAYADLVVAADGANTKIRKYLTDIERIYSGSTIVEGNIYNAAINAPKLWNLTNGGKIFALWQGKNIVLSAKGEGSLSFYTITTETEQWADLPGINFNLKDEVLYWFKERFSDWSADWHEIFKRDESYFVHRPQYYFPTDQSWQSLPNLTLLGDAAHQTPPSGDGVNQAMLDGLELSNALLGTFKNLQSAIAHYENEMLKRTAVATEEALEMSTSMLADNNLEYMLEFFRTKND